MEVLCAHYHDVPDGMVSHPIGHSADILRGRDEFDAQPIIPYHGP